MTLTGSPPAYTRGYSFTSHSQLQPSTPHNGARLDAEFDDISAAINAYITSLSHVLAPDGSLAPGTVGPDQLVPGLFNQVADNAVNRLQPFVNAALDAVQQVSLQASYVHQDANAAVAAANHAYGSAATVLEALGQAATLSATVKESTQSAEDWAKLSENSANSSENAMEESWRSRDKAFQWAEYLAGPVDPAPPGWPEAVDDGLWSSKWWAIRAREIVGAWGGLYLGAFPTPPIPDGNNPWPPGTIYYDTTQGEMLVWDGAAWVPITQPGPSVSSTFIYKAAANQQDFAGADFNGKTPAINASRPQPNDVHVNGVRLVEDKGHGLGDYTVNPNTSALHVNVPLTLDSIVQWDLLLTPADLAPGAVIAWKLKDVDKNPTTNLPGEFNGVTTTFPMSYTDSGGTPRPATPGTGVQLQVSLDGVMQEFGVDFTTSGSNIIFTEAPPAKTRFWAVWYQPGVSP